jgi:hypothetical protein
MPALSEHSNVYNSALLVAQAKGYDIWYRKETDQYCAQKNGWDFWASSPCGLLGLIAMFEHISPEEYREYWWQVDGPEVYSESLPSSPPKAYVSVTKKKRTAT